MQLQNSNTRYGLVSYLFHWLIGLMIFIMLAVGFNFDNIPLDQRASVYAGHKATGVIILILAFLRLSWRTFSAPPQLPSTVTLWQAIASKVTVIGLYIVMFLMPMSGITGSVLGGRAIDVFGMFTIPALTENKDLSSMAFEVHEFCAVTLVCLIVLHFAGALYHYFISKDNILQRMLYMKESQN